MNGFNLETNKLSAKLYRDKENFNDIAQLNIGFYEAKVHFITATYSLKSVSFSSGEQFAKTISDKFKIPFTTWKNSGLKSSVNCGEIGIYADADFNRLTITDLILQNQILKDDEKRVKFKA